MTAAPVRRMAPEETVHRSQRRTGRGRWFVLCLILLVFVLSGGIVWLAYVDGGAFTPDEPPPLIKAEPGPIKRMPDDPGGQAVPNEKSAAAQLFGEKEQRPRIEQILPRQAPPPLAPPEPPPDLTEAELAPPATGDTTTPPPGAAIPGPPAGEPPSVAALAPATPPTPPPATGPLPIPPRALLPTPPVAAQPQPAPPVPTPTPAAPRPVAPAAPASAPVVTATRTPVPAEPAHSAPVAGPIFRVQLGAFRSEGAAGQAWLAYQQQHGDVLGNLRSNIVIAETSSGTFFRLQAGPLPNRDAAVRACTQIKSGGGDCFIVGPLP